jgi:hypothetical protein
MSSKRESTPIFSRPGRSPKSVSRAICVCAVGAAVVELFELVAVPRVHGVREVREEVESVVERVRVRLQRPTTHRSRGLERQRVPVRAAAVRRVHEAEAVEQARTHGALRDLVRRDPFALVERGRHRPGVAAFAARVLQQRVGAAEFLLEPPRAIGATVLETPEQVAPGEARRPREHAPRVRVLAQRERQDVAVERAAVSQVHGARR